MASSTRIVRLALLGDVSEPLQRLVQDGLTDGGACCQLVTLPAGAVDVVLVMISFGDVAHRIAVARLRAAGAPVLAILPFTDDGLAARVLDCGAAAWYALDTPLARLPALVVTLAGEPRPRFVRRDASR